ncbi:uncharacterized protein MYCFIDRAFT_172732 [Pseudocercospora fijiensis CIRAD86]|uniref:Uncharacterized protein n=1 Tax=Pseudocercospora fijiensis (strain CIRAD86) TaxID=383855 RepID=M2ZB27_PSEFD|nr:uncharacterized protein MYCFIDRAFT_172732 [Pseudocercospora fijiensis CIRAD86]EME87060.1 hypothetical protein MYCFIDRAFT_172732 [Pseudocercospora fijiensis CIRAD86]
MRRYKAQFRSFTLTLSYSFPWRGLFASRLVRDRSALELSDSSAFDIASFSLHLWTSFVFSSRAESVKMAATTASWRVFHTAELLEQILLDVSPASTGQLVHDANYEYNEGDEIDDEEDDDEDALSSRLTLLRCQRVSIAFRNTIASSPQLQRCLFFSPPSAPTANSFHLNTLAISKDAICYLCHKLDFGMELYNGQLNFYFCDASWFRGALQLSKVDRQASWRRMYLRSGGLQVERIAVWANRGRYLIPGGPYRQRVDWEVSLADPTIGDGRHFTRTEPLARKTRYLS